MARLCLVLLVASAMGVVDVDGASATAQFYEYENCTTPIGPVFSMSPACTDITNVVQYVLEILANETYAFAYGSVIFDPVNQGTIFAGLDPEDGACPNTETPFSFTVPLNVTPADVGRCYKRKIPLLDISFGVEITSYSSGAVASGLSVLAAAGVLLGSFLLM